MEIHISGNVIKKKTKKIISVENVIESNAQFFVRYSTCFPV